MKKYLDILLENLFDESQESKSIESAKKYLMKNGYGEKDADDFVRIEVRNNFPVLRDKKAGKFILGVTRISIEEMETLSPNNMITLNNIIKLITDEHYNEYDRNLNGLSGGEIFRRFSKESIIKIENEKMALNNENYSMNNEYKIIPINSFEDAKKYSSYTDWCITHDENMYNTYTNNGINQFYFCLKNGFENVVRKENNNNPLDDYGLSMLAICVDENGGLYTCTSRWNHDCGADDSVMNAKEISKVIGISFFRVFKPNNKFEKIVSGIETRLTNGESPEAIFDVVGEFVDGVANVMVGNKANWISADGKLLSPKMWFDTTDPFIGGYAVVSLKHSWNFMKRNGVLCNDDIWFDNIEQVFNQYGLAVVKKNGNLYYYKTDGSLIPYVTELDVINDFNSNGLAKVVKITNNSPFYNLIKKDGNLLLPKIWFDELGDFVDGFAFISINDSYNYIDIKGNYLTKYRWYDDAWDFENGLGEVSYKGKWYNIDTEGNLIENPTLNENVQSKLKKARKETDTNPSEAEKKSGNYKKGKLNVNGFKISLENPKGSFRKGVDGNGNEWKIKMKNDYGYFLNTMGYDGDAIDVFLGSDIDSKKIFVIDQKINNKFDESKVMLWFSTKEKAKNAYLSNYEKGWKGFDEITEVDETFFKKWLYDGKKQRKPFHEYYEVKNKVKNMAIKESILRNLIQESINKVLIKEGRESTIMTNKLIKKLYAAAQPFTTHKYRDNSWENVSELMKILFNIDGVADYEFCNGTGKYHSVNNGGLYKEYIFNIKTNYNTIINGNLRCCFAGTVDDPLSSYDIVVSFDRERFSPNIENIKESICENRDNIYSKEDWNRDGTLHLEIGQYIEDEVFNELLNSVPPTTYKSTLFQPGEAYTMSGDYVPLYMTFDTHDGYWRYIGLCPKGSNKRMLAYDEETIEECKTLNEGKGLNSKKLYELVKTHGGFAKGVHNFYLNTASDNDVIGELSRSELDILHDAYPRDLINWAMEKGYTVNKGDNVELLPLKDYTWIAIIERGSLLNNKEYVKTPIGALKSKRERNRSKIDGTKEYRWQDTNGWGSERQNNFIQRQWANKFAQRFKKK